MSKEDFKLIQKAEERLVECECCGCYHPKDFYGDCRDDSNRYSTPEEYAHRELGMRDIE